MQLTEQDITKLNQVRLEDGWKTSLTEFLLSERMDQLRAFLKSEIQADKVIYPPSSLIFNAFNTTPLQQVKAVIIGQDPYHGPDQAHGLHCHHLCVISFTSLIQIWVLPRQNMEI